MAPHLKLSQTCFPSSCLLCFRVVGSTQISHSSRVGGQTNRQTDKCLPHLTVALRTLSIFFLLVERFQCEGVFSHWQCIACARRSSTPLRPRSSSVWRGGSTLSLYWFQVVVHDITRASNSEGIKCPAVILVNTLRPCACR